MRTSRLERIGPGLLGLGDGRAGMKQLVIDDDLGGSEEPGYRFPGVRAVGPCRSSLFAPPDFALQMTRATLARGHGTALVAARRR